MLSRQYTSSLVWWAKSYMTMRAKSILKSGGACCIHLLAWILVYQIIVRIFSATPHASNYALLSGWWCALYFAHLFQIKPIVSIPLIIGYLVVGMVSFSTKLSLLSLLSYHDPPTEFSGMLFYILLIQSIIFISPILISSSVRITMEWFIARLKGQKNCAAQ